MPSNHAVTQPGLAPARDRPFVGRAAELAVLDAALARAAGGEPTVALVSGEAGIGKTRLVLELAERAEAQDVIALLGTCVELSVPAPYLPVAQALRRVVHALPADRVEEIAAARRADLGLLVPELRLPGGDVRTLSPELARGRLFEGIFELLAGAARERPVLVLIDDLQWADRSTLDVLRFLVRAVRDERLLLVLTCRSPSAVLPSAAREAFADIGRSPHAVLLELRGLETQAIAAQLAALLGQAPDRQVTASVARRSQGNPFYVEQLAGHLQSGEVALPEQLREALLASLVELPAEAVRALDVLALGGGGIPYDVLAEVAGIPGDDLDRALRPAVERRLVQVADGTYAIGHALLHEALASRLLPGESRRLHEALASRLETSGASPSTLAHHWAAAGVPTRAYPAAVEAGKAASASCAFPEAHDHYEAALALREQLPEEEGDAVVPHDELLALAAEAAAAAGRFDVSEPRFREAIAAAAGRPTEQRALLQLRLAFPLFRLGRVAESCESVRRAAELMRPLPASAVRANVFAGAALSLIVQQEDRSTRPMCEEALADARAVGARAEEGRALAALGLALFLDGEADEGIACLTRAWDIAREIGAEEDAARTALNLAWKLDDQGAAARVSLDGLARAREAGLDRAFGTLLRSSAIGRLVFAGRLAEAHALAAEPIPPASDVWSEVGLLARLAWVAGLTGDDDEARAALARAREVAEPLPPDHHLWGELGTVAALIELDSGDAAAALDHVRDALERLGAMQATSLAELCAVGVRAAAELAARARALRLGDEATAAVREGRALAERGRSPGARQSREEQAMLALLAAEEADLEGGAAMPWRDALAAVERVERVPDVAYASVRLAEALAVARAPAAEVRAAITDAIERTRTLGIPRLEARIVALARACRVVPHAAADEPPLTRLGLTPRELEVLGHLAEGKTNRDIAADLVITAKTASHHVSSILAKLDVRTRGEAAAVARRLGIEPGSEATP